MKKTYTVTIDTYASMSIVVEAESPEEAENNAEEYIQNIDFFDEYRKGCDFFEPTVNDIVEEE